MKQLFKNNLMFIVFIVFTSIVDLTTLAIITRTAFVGYPWMSFFWILILFFMYNLISSIRARKFILYSCAIFELLVNLLCVTLYENTGTIFDFSMLQLASETSHFMNTVTINYWYIAYICLLYLLFVLSSSAFAKKIDKEHRLTYQPFICSLCLIASIIGQCALIFNANKMDEKKFINTLYQNTNDKYARYGITSNFINEIAKMALFNNYDQLTNDEIKEFIYSEVSTPTSYFGVSEGNNLITILVESFEWFGFINATELYPNGANLSEEKLELMFPNLRKFYNESMIMNNHYSQNKTDISEDEAILGMYPNSAYINYGFDNPVLPSSIPNLLKYTDNTIENNFVHSNEKDFYNREKISNSLGYENKYFVDYMVDKGLENFLVNKPDCINCMNKDSEVINAVKEEVFPQDKRFNTHITTISMHGNYTTRNNMKRWLDKMDSIGVHVDDYFLENYLAAVMEFDYSLGLLMSDLNSKGLLDNTTIVMYSDHNTYLSGLTYNIKNIPLDSYKENYIELYRVPLMIYDQNIGHKVINKFTTTYDIVPTILDLFGINYYKNLYFGNSIFSSEESVLYSKAFNVYIADGLMFSNINDILYKDKNLTDEYIKTVETKCLAILKKLYYVNHIFEYNYFKDQRNYDLFISKMNNIN